MLVYLLCYTGLRGAEFLADLGEDWPVIPTLHRPTLTQHVQKGLREAGVDDDEIEALRDAKPDLVLAAEYDLSAAPVLKPNVARRVMKRLSEAAELEIDDDHGYLTPHGGRRGMGEVMVREFGYAAAARYLDNSEEMVWEAYQHIEAADRADQATEALSSTDQRISSESESGREGRDDDECDGASEGSEQVSRSGIGVVGAVATAACDTCQYGVTEGALLWVGGTAGLGLLVYGFFTLVGRQQDGD